MFATAVVEPHVRDPGFFYLGSWDLDVVYFGVQPEWIDILSEMWYKGEMITVSFWHRRQWCTGQAYVYRVSPRAQYGQMLSVAMKIMGTKELKKGSLWL
jgi:hypothetical protein